MNRVNDLFPGVNLYYSKYLNKVITGAASDRTNVPGLNVIFDNTCRPIDSYTKFSIRGLGNPV